MCDRAGMKRYFREGREKTDTTTLKRRLGLTSNITRRRRKKNGAIWESERFCTEITYETALMLCKALDVDPVDFGL